MGELWTLLKDNRSRKAWLLKGSLTLPFLVAALFLWLSWRGEPYEKVVVIFGISGVGGVIFQVMGIVVVFVRHDKRLANKPKTRVAILLA